MLDFEIVSVRRALTLGGNLSATRVLDLLSDVDQLAIERWPSAVPLRRRAFQLRNIIAAYDAAHLVLAEALDCSLVTRDGRLSRSNGHDVRTEVL